MEGVQGSLGGFQGLSGGDVQTAGKHVVPTGVLTLEFCQDWLENPHGAHVFFRDLL